MLLREPPAGLPTGLKCQRDSSAGPCRGLPKLTSASAPAAGTLSTPQSSAGAKVSHAGFWRLLVVREGREHTFLPLPAAAAGGDGGAAASGGGGGLLTGCAMADVPVERWAVPVAADGADAAAVRRGAR